MLLTDGGVTTDTDSREFASILKEISEIERETRDRPTTVETAHIVKVVDEFLSTPRGGGGYVSGLYLTGRVIVRHEITPADISELAVEREPEKELLSWALRQNPPDESPELSEEAFAYCLDRSEWRKLLLEALRRTESGSGLTDDQLTTLASGAEDAENLLPLAKRLRKRGLTSEARDLFVSHFERDVDRREPAALLREADEHELIDQFPGRLRASLARWQWEDGEKELEALAELGCEHDQYNEVLLAVNRWLREREGDTVPDQHRVLVARAIEALIRREGTGEADAMLLYREHLYPANSLYGLGADLYEAADRTDETDVTEDVLRVYDRGSVEETVEDIADARLAAEAAEEEGRLDEAFEIWERIIEQKPSREIICSAIENRLSVLRLSDAEDLVEQLKSADHHQYANAYELRIAAAGGDPRQVIDTAQSDGVFNLDGHLKEEVSKDYIQALSELRRWEKLKSFLDDTVEIDADLRRFYLRLAKLMEFVGEGESSLDGEDSVELAERLFTSPINTEQLQLVLNLDLVGQLDGRLRSSFPEAHDRMDVVRGLLEILVSLHAERHIDALGEAGVDTEDFEQRLAEAALGQGIRQLLSELSRESRRAGVVTNNGH